MNKTEAQNELHEPSFFKLKLLSSAWVSSYFRAVKFS